jgi:hypothetical protein
MPYRTNDYPPASGRPFNRVEHSVVSHPRRPSPGKPSDEWFSDGVGFDCKVGQGFQHGIAE